LVSEEDYSEANKVLDRNQEIVNEIINSQIHNSQVKENKNLLHISKLFIIFVPS
jgi:hypothetical protein